MTTSPLFDPIKFGAITLRNRIVMAPLTRSRATDTGDVLDMHATYYGQRASAGLIIAEATWVSPEGRGFAWTPGIHSQSNVDAWRGVTDRVHEAGGRIILQLWHVGRCSHPDLQPDGVLPIAPSALSPGMKVFTPDGFKEAPTPRALDISELPGLVDVFTAAATNAKKAGFDGVEVHGANGYLLDQFLCDASNKRTDAYGGSIENRMRFPLEVLDAVIDVWGASAVGIRLSPTSFVKNAGDSDPETVFSRFVQELSERQIAYIHVIEGQTGGDRDTSNFKPWHLKDKFSGLYIGNNGYTRDMALERISADQTDLVAFGRPYISNPDLVDRLKRNIPLADWDPATFYGGGEAGYTDYTAAAPDTAS